MDILCKVTTHGLVPMYDSDLDMKKRLRVGSVVRCRVNYARNYAHHKKFFALVRLTFDNLPSNLAERWCIHNEEDMLRRFKRDLGYYTSIYNELGEREIEYQSISFASMDQYEFEQFYNRCIDLVMHRYIQGLGREDLLTEIDNFK